MSVVQGEIDRQLTEQRTRSDALATRAGLLIGAVGVLAALLKAAEHDAGPRGWLLVSIGVSTVAGIAVLWMARLVPGPTPTELRRLAAAQDGAAELERTKLVTLEANARAVARVELLFAVQAIGIVLAIFAVVMTLQGW